jgi:hypothetical protein
MFSIQPARSPQTNTTATPFGIWSVGFVPAGFAIGEVIGKVDQAYEETSSEFV